MKSSLDTSSPFDSGPPSTAPVDGLSKLRGTLAMVKVCRKELDTAEAAFKLELETMEAGLKDLRKQHLLMEDDGGQPKTH